MAYLLLMHFCPFSPILLFKLPYLGATEQLQVFIDIHFPKYFRGVYRRDSMKGSEAKMTGFMEGADKRYIIPVYQRKYD